MRHQIGTMVTGIDGTEANECNIQGEFTFDFATRTYTGNNQLGSGLVLFQLFIMVKKSLQASLLLMD